MTAVRAAEPTLNQWQVHAKAKDMLVTQAVAKHIEVSNLAAVGSADEAAAAGGETASSSSISSSGGGVTVRRRKPEALDKQQQQEAVEEWAVHQIGHALDYATESRFWLHVSNGLNLQVVHHLFPQVCALLCSSPLPPPPLYISPPSRCLLRSVSLEASTADADDVMTRCRSIDRSQVGWGHHMELSPIVAEVCAEFGITYNVKPTFWAAMSGHLAHLANVNDTDAKGSVWVKPRMGDTCAASVQTLTVLDQLDALADGSMTHRGQRIAYAS